MRETMSNIISVDLTNKLDLIKTKTLIIWGEKDKMTPLTDGKLMNYLIKGSKMYIVKNSGHSPYFTNAQEVSLQILNEIKS
jgi:pimeloyl-ACP methyl ester carboxylesterase